MAAKSGGGSCSPDSTPCTGCGQSPPLSNSPYCLKCILAIREEQTTNSDAKETFSGPSSKSKTESKVVEQEMNSSVRDSPLTVDDEQTRKRHRPTTPSPQDDSSTESSSTDESGSAQTEFAKRPKQLSESGPETPSSPSKSPHTTSERSSKSEKATDSTGANGTLVRNQAMLSDPKKVTASPLLSRNEIQPNPQPHDPTKKPPVLPAKDKEGESDKQLDEPGLALPTPAPVEASQEQPNAVISEGSESARHNGSNGANPRKQPPQQSQSEASEGKSKVQSSLQASSSNHNLPISQRNLNSKEHVEGNARLPLPDKQGSNSNISGDEHKAANLQDGNKQAPATRVATGSSPQDKPSEGSNNRKVCYCYTSLHILILSLKFEVL